MGNSNGNQFRDDETVVLTENRDGKRVKSIHPKIGGRLRLAHEQNQQISITTEVVRYDESVAVVRAVTTTMKGMFPGRGRIRFYRTKNRRERTEYLMPRTRQALLEWREHQDWIRHRKRIEDRGPGFVFSKLDGRRLGCFNRSWRKACQIAGFPGLHFHDLRHTFCSNLILSGGDLKDAKEMIGHRNLKMTDRYAHLTSLRKLSRQEDLARFYSNSEGMKESSEPHISRPEVKNGPLNEKRAD